MTDIPGFIEIDATRLRKLAEAAELNSELEFKKRTEELLARRRALRSWWDRLWFNDEEFVWNKAHYELRQDRIATIKTAASADGKVFLSIGEYRWLRGWAKP